MKTALLSIGDELLIGQTVNTNASWLGSELTLLGIPVNQVITLSDERTAILSALTLAVENHDLVIVTGGLGPTQDDITKAVLCEFFNTNLEMNAGVLTQVEAFFAQRNRPMLEVNRMQAMVPKACEVINNTTGTAPGMWFETNGKIVVSLPGVPSEMKTIMRLTVFDKLVAYFNPSSIYHQTISLTGIGESFFAAKIADWETKVRLAGFDLAYLPSPGLLKLRLTTSKGLVAEQQITAYFDELREEYPQYIFGSGAERLTEVVGNLLKSEGKTVGTVESCTGGAVVAALIEEEGASAYVSGGLVTYTDEQKQKLVGISTQLLTENGAVSEEVVCAMAAQGRERLGVDYCVATSGYLGATGETEKNPNGTVWISVAHEKNVLSQQLNFGSSRVINIQMCIFAALNLLRNALLENKNEKK